MIRKFSAILFSIFLLLPLSVSAEMEIFKIGYVVVEKVLKNAPQTAASNKKLEKEFKSRTDGLQKKVKAIQKQEKDFNKNSVTIAAADRLKAQKKIQNSKIEILPPFFNTLRASLNAISMFVTFRNPNAIVY